MKKCDFTPASKRATSSITREKIPSPQDPFPIKSMRLAIPHLGPNLPGVSDQVPSPSPKRKPRSAFSKTLPINQSQPYLLTPSNNTSPLVENNHRNPFSNSNNMMNGNNNNHRKEHSLTCLNINSNINTNSIINNNNKSAIVKEEVNFDDFFVALSTSNYVSSIEYFVGANLNAKTVIYWEEVPSIQRLITEELHISVSHNESLVGFAFKQRNVVIIPVAQEHPSFDPKIDKQCANPLSLIIFIPLFDYRNHVTALLQVVKKHNDNYVKDSDRLFIDNFTKKFKSFSHWILQSRGVDEIAFDLMKFDETTQFLLNFQQKMFDLFDAVKAEIWLIGSLSHTHNNQQNVTSNANKHQEDPNANSHNNNINNKHITNPNNSINNNNYNNSSNNNINNDNNNSSSNSSNNSSNNNKQSTKESERYLMLFRGGDVFEVSQESCGVVSDIIKKAQLFNCPNTRLQSSYLSSIDGEECPLLGMPVLSLQSTVVIILRGRNQDSIFSASNELLLSQLAPFIATGFLNTLKGDASSKGRLGDAFWQLSGMLPSATTSSNSSSSTANASASTSTSATVTAHIIETTRNEIVAESMSSVLALTDATRCTYYVIEKDHLVSIFHTGLKTGITLQLGKGHAGNAAAKGVVMNVAEAYNDLQFDPSFDESSGFKTISLLSVPIFATNGSVVAVVQVMNKKNGIPFSTADTNVCRIFGTFCSLLSDNFRLFSMLNDMTRRTELLFKSLLATLSQPDGNLISMTCDMLKNIFHTDQCDTFLYDEAGECLIGQKSTLNGKKGSAAFCFSKNESFFVNDIDRDARTVGEPFSNVCLAPLVSRPNGELIGVFRAINKPQPFDESDLKMMLLFSSIISMLANEMKLNRYIEKGISQLAIDKVISKAELGQCRTPLRMKLEDKEDGTKDVNKKDDNKKDNDKKDDSKSNDNKNDEKAVTSINFATLTYGNLDRIVYYAFDSLGLMSEFSISNDKLLSFIYNVKKLYYDKPFHNFEHAADMCQFFLYLVKTAHMLEFLRGEEILVFLIACVGAYIRTDETNNSFQKKSFSPAAILYSDKPIQKLKCAKMMHILEKEKCNLFQKVTNIRDAWELLFELLMVTDNEAIDNSVDKLTQLVSESTVDLNNQSHRHLLLTVLFESCQFAFLARPINICRDWFAREREEMIMLGDRETEKHFQYSSIYNSRESSDDMTYEITELSKIGIPLFKVTASFLGELTVLTTMAKENLRTFENAAQKRRMKISAK